MFRDRLLMLAALAVGGVAALAAAGPPGPRDGVEALPLEAVAVPFDTEDPAARPARPMRFLGAVALRSEVRRFGGLSGLAWAPGCGRLLAISDTGNWVVLEPVLAGGRLTGVSAAWIAPMRDASGEWRAGKARNDAEALAQRGNTAWVAFEQRHRVRRYEGIDACRPETLAAPAASEFPVPGSENWGDNAGAESLAVLPDGRLLAIAEGRADGETRNGRRHGRIWREGGAVERFTWIDPPGHSPTDAAVLGDRLLVLHRMFSATSGVGAVLQSAALGDLPRAPRPVVELLRLAPPRTVDNMEGLAVQRAGARTFVWIVSDDNFAGFQRTILMRFELLASPPGAPSPRSGDRVESGSR